MVGPILRHADAERRMVASRRIARMNRYESLIVRCQSRKRSFFNFFDFRSIVGPGFSRLHSTGEEQN
jgi:hypothetical protein